MPVVQITSGSITKLGAFVFHKAFRDLKYSYVCYYDCVLIGKAVSLISICLLLNSLFGILLSPIKYCIALLWGKTAKNEGGSRS